MTDVACFCDCFFSFDGGAGACPKCGEVASVTGLPPRPGGWVASQEPDAEQAICYPALPAWTRLHELIQTSFGPQRRRPAHRPPVRRGRVGRAGRGIQSGHYLRRADRRRPPVRLPTVR